MLRARRSYHLDGLSHFGVVDALCRKNGLSHTVVDFHYLSEWYVLSTLQGAISGPTYQHQLTELIKGGVIRAMSDQDVQRR